MDHSEKVDQDAVLRARTMLLGSGRLELGRRVEAYRVLSAVSPLTYLPKLVEALLSYGYAQEAGNPAEVQLARRAEAVAAARAIDDKDPKKTDLLVRALDAFRHQLYLLGRRTEGFAMCEEMAEAGKSGFERGQVKSPVYGHGPLVVVLAEEGRYQEAAEWCEQMVRSEHEQESAELPFWDMVEWVAALDASGRHEAAVEVLAELVDDTRARCAEDDTALAILTWELVHQAGLLDGVGRRAEAVVARQEALALLTELDLTGERKSWSNIHSWWGTLFAMSGRSAEPVPSASAPGPSFGSAFLQWSPDIKQAYFGSMASLKEQVEELREAARTDPGRHLPELVAAHRRLMIRCAVYRENRSHLILKPLRPVFNEHVDLARCLADKEVLARALTDRSMFLLAAHQYGEAYDDFVEVCELLN
ncbi:hypothetical protein AQJ46_03230 [Streptomyces canus]|uniref:Tetratricopeptide repeat protein n=1 Tax=Streptomyces canus TaxID=58343 RepID=A0A101SIH3_9ACTN|nr:MULTISPECIES: hypothetical protein [Streptomyces]KUN74560.1 hypothetical protein AQJ46_03230 [Streptomyces canus]MDI5910519.1 hypothetical protein [Streptomyces sp. 12257]